MFSEREFPVLLSWDERKRKRISWRRTVPWSLLAPHEDQAIYNHGQTLQRLAERGGLGPDEMVCVIDGKKLRDAPKLLDAIKRMDELIAQHEAHAHETCE